MPEFFATPTPPASMLFTRQEVATRTALSIASVDRLIARHELKAVRIGRAVRVRAADLARFVAGLEVVR